MSGDVHFLKDHAALVYKLLDYTFDACLICKQSDTGLSTLFANQTFYSLTEQSEKDVIGFPPQLTANKSSADNIYEEILNNFNENRTYEKECSGINRSGNPFWAIVRSFPVEESGGKFCIILIKDITIRRKRENELTKAVKSVEESKVVKDKFLANMSHEMRTPLNGILGMSQLLEGTSLDSEQREFVEELRHSAENLLAIVNDILEFNFLKSTKFKLEKRKFSLRKQLNSLVETIKGRADEKGLKLELAVSEKMPETLVGDSVRLAQILMNVVGNSIKFTNEGSITIFVRTLESENGRVPVEFKVKDTGIGIPESMVSDIFETFNQASKSTSYKYGGTGIGLSIVKQVVGHMDGRINVESEIGKGTTITVILPFGMPESVPEFKSTDQSDSAGEIEQYPGYRVLIADDYPLNRRIVKGMMKKFGVEVDEAEDGTEAIEMSDKHDYSAIFMDVHMPEMGGLEATRKIREREKASGKHTPIIAVTASVLDRDIEECNNAGMDGFMAKPFTYNEIYQKFKQYVVESSPSSRQNDDSNSEKSEELFLQNLEEMTGGDKGLMVEMINLFLNQTPDLMNQIVDHFEKREYELVKSSSHTLKPTFTYVGMEEATELTKEIEELSAQENVPEEELNALIEKLKIVSEQAIARVSELKNRYL